MMTRAIAILFACSLLAAGVEDPGQAAFDAAAKALVAGDYPSAESGFQSVLKTQPRHVGALGNLGIIYSRTGRTAQAVAAYRRALEVSPNDKAILLNLGLVYLKQEAHRKALPLFERVSALDPAHQQARQLTAVCRLYTGQVVLAIRDLESLRNENPNDQQTLFLLGFAFFGLDRDHIRIPRRQIQKNPFPQTQIFLQPKINNNS